jgi:hypothetical protein
MNWVCVVITGMILAGCRNDGGVLETSYGNEVDSAFDLVPHLISIKGSISEASRQVFVHVVNNTDDGAVIQRVLPNCACTVTQAGPYPEVAAYGAQRLALTVSMAVRMRFDVVIEVKQRERISVLKVPVILDVNQPSNKRMATLRWIRMCEPECVKR